jgi:hypothetical protein
MKILATRIAKELESAKHCAVYEPELMRVWPDGRTREVQISSFAKKHGWRLLTTATDSARYFIKSRLAENVVMALFLRARKRLVPRRREAKRGHFEPSPLLLR